MTENQSVDIMVCVVKIAYADVAELADAPDLGSGVYDVGVQVPSSAGERSLVFKTSFFMPGIIDLANFRKKFRKFEVRNVKMKQRECDRIVHNAERMSLKRKKSHESFLN